MKTSSSPIRTALCVSLIGLSSCASLTLEHVDFGWPVEAKLTVNDNNTIEEDRSSTTFSVANLSMEEFQDSSALKGTTLRLIRSSEGYYFLTGPRFKNVYVFSPAPHELRLSGKIEVSQSGLKDPALNQRTPYVELIDGGSLTVRLTSDDIAEGSK